LDFDVIVYGATSGGVTAAVAAANHGMKTALLDPKQRVGGMSSGGLGRTDVGGDPAHVIGGLAREFYLANGKHYKKYDVEYNLEPHVALQLFHGMINRSFTSPGSIQLFQNTAVASVQKDGPVIKSLTTINDKVFTAKAFVDTSYEGDLMVRSGVSSTYGRESATKYNESLAGFYAAKSHQFKVKINPFNDRGEPLDMVRLLDVGEATGLGDKKVQAYNFRMCVTQNTTNQVAFPKPVKYNSSYWELARRYFNHPQITPSVAAPCGNVAGYCGGTIPNSKYDLNNGGPISTDFISGSWGYPIVDLTNASHHYEEREKIFQAHKEYTLSFLWFMSNDPDLNSTIRAKFQQWGFCKDEFQSTGHFPPQLYVRSVRRMVGSDVFTQNSPTHQRHWGNSSVGCGSYNFDSHNSERIACHNRSECLGSGPPGDMHAGDGGVDDASVGYAWTEGDVEVSPQGAYDIPLWAILPQQHEAVNLVAPSTPSASHIGMSTLRMEPQFMIMGHSAGIISALAVSTARARDCSCNNSLGRPCDSTCRAGLVHNVDPDALHAVLLADGQRMNAACSKGPPPPTPPTPAPPAAYNVSGAGETGCNGVFKLSHSFQRDPGVPAYEKVGADNGPHYIYRFGGEWRVADGSKVLYYVAKDQWGQTPPTDRSEWVGAGATGCSKCIGASPPPAMAQAM
jgi:hypothetical protein